MTTMKPRVVRHSMSEQEREMAIALGTCSLLPATAAKRIALTLAARAQAEEPEISDKEAAMLRSLVYTYRRQIPLDIVTLAGDVPQQRRDWKAQHEWRAAFVEQRQRERSATPDEPALLFPTPTMREQLDVFAETAL